MNDIIQKHLQIKGYKATELVTSLQEDQTFDE